MNLSVHHRNLVRVLARTLFTRDRTPEIDGDDANVEARFVAWHARLPPLQGAALVGALGAFDVAYGAWAGRPGTSFVQGAHGERVAFLEACAETGPYHARQLFEALRLAMIAAYVDSPAVAAAIGLDDPVALARTRCPETP